jgi:hypothetical protein
VVIGKSHYLHTLNLVVDWQDCLISLQSMVSHFQVYK